MRPTRAGGYKAITISTIVDAKYINTNTVIGYKAITISTIVDIKRVTKARLLGYKAITISTIVDRRFFFYSASHRL